MNNFFWFFLQFCKFILVRNNIFTLAYCLKRDEKSVPIYPKFRTISISEERRRC